MEKEVVTEVEVLEQRESYGYGSYVSEQWFLGRFRHKDVWNPLQLVKVINREPHEVVAITGATITSRAVVKAVNAAMENFTRLKESGKLAEMVR